jgi:O-antigen ligase
VFLSFVFSGRRRVAIVAALVIAVVGIVVYIKMPALFVSIGERMAEITKSAITRYDIRILGIELGMSHPLLGIGAGQFRALTEFATAHNEGLNILAEHGIAALLLYILFWIYIAYMALKLRLHRDLLMRSLAGVFLVIMPIYLAYAQIQPMYFNRGGALFAFCLGMLVTLYYRSKDEDRVHGSL